MRPTLRTSRGATRGSPGDGGEPRHARTFAQRVDRRHQARLGALITALTPLAIAIGAFNFSVGLAFGDSVSLRSGLLLIAYGVVLLWAWRETRRQRVDAAARLASVGLLAVNAALGFVVPDHGAVFLLMPLIAVAVALPYVNRRELFALMAVAWIECIWVSMLAASSVPLGTAPLWFTIARRVVGAAVTSGVVLALTWQFKVRSEDTLAVIRNREEFAQAAKARYRALFDGNPVGLFRVNADATILDANPALLATLRVEDAKAILGSVASWLPPDLLDEARTHDVRGRDVAAQRADGSAAWLRLSVRAVRAGSNGLFEGSAEDITEQHATQERLLQAMKLETVGRLAGGVAHDFNNLLTAIRGYADVLALELPPEGHSRDAVGQIVRASDRAALLTAQLLAVGRRQLLQPAPVELGDLLTDVAPTLRQVVGPTVGVAIDCEDGAGRVSADPTQFEQVLLNLAANARDAMPKGGLLTVAVRNADLDVAEGDVPAGSWVVLSVRDTGTGTDETTRQHAFDPFYTTKPVGKGSGMGLASVYGIVVQHGGVLSLESAPGAGSTFTIHLPRVAEWAVSPARPHALAAPVTPDVEPVNAASGRILAEPAASSAPLRSIVGPAEPVATIMLVEDDRALRTLMERILTWNGYAVIATVDSEQAMAMDDEALARVDLLITDVVMPGSDGPTVARALEARRPGLQTLYVSGYAESAIFEPALRGRGTYLAKPYTPDALLSRIRRLLGLEEAAA